jgi:hypothetical protein
MEIREQAKAVLINQADISIFFFKNKNLYCSYSMKN